MIKPILKNLFSISIIATTSILFFWLVIFKIIAKFRNAPCPSGLSFLIGNPVRRYYTKPVLDRVGIQPGEKVLELGPGPGLFTINVSKRLGPNGKLIAVDIQQEMINKLEKLLKKKQITNVETKVASAYELSLQDNSIDRAFLVTVLPEIPDMEKALKELFRVLKPGGIFSDTEEFLDPDYPLASTVIRHAEKVGFKLKKRFGSFWLYTLNFIKPI